MRRFFDAPIWFFPKSTFHFRRKSFLRLLKVYLAKVKDSLRSRAKNVFLIWCKECKKIALLLATLEPFLLFFSPIILYLWHLLTQSASRITAGTKLYKTIKKINTWESWLCHWQSNNLNTQSSNFVCTLQKFISLKQDIIFSLTGTHILA